MDGKKREGEEASLVACRLADGMTVGIVVAVRHFKNKPQEPYDWRVHTGRSLLRLIRRLDAGSSGGAQVWNERGSFGTTLLSACVCEHLMMVPYSKAKVKERVRRSTVEGSTRPNDNRKHMSMLYRVLVH